MEPAPGVSPAVPAAPVSVAHLASTDRLVVVVAPDSFKGSLTSVEVAGALAEGWHAARPGDEIRIVPQGDGGQGTLDAVAAAGGWSVRRTTAHDPNMRRIRARWLRSDDGGRALVEMAEASGLSLVPVTEREPLAATTLGTGEILRAVLDEGLRQVTLGIGGSATTDGGAGVVQALGGRLLEIDGQPLFAGAGPGLFADVVTVDLRSLDPRLADVELRIASDVTNPLLGPTGAAAVYGPQKGADPERVRALDAALATWADLLEAATGREERERPGAGAAGGLGFGLLCLADRFGSVTLEPGAAMVQELTGLSSRLDGADLVLTGEGRIDAQTAFGKTALGVARRALAAGVPCIAVGGSVEPEGAAALVAEGAIAEPVWTTPVPLDEAIAAGRDPVVACGERLARRVGAREDSR